MFKTVLILISESPGCQMKIMQSVETQRMDSDKLMYFRKQQGNFAQHVCKAAVIFELQKLKSS
jgi:hypothetical protein